MVSEEQIALRYKLTVFGPVASESLVVGGWWVELEGLMNVR